MNLQVYLKLHLAWINATGIKKGSKVRITKRFEREETGGKFTHILEMDSFIGQEGTVTIVTGTLIGVIPNGSRHSYNYPHFCLEILEVDPPNESINQPFVSGKITINKKGGLDAGCLHKDPEETRKMVQHIDSINQILGPGYPVTIRICDYNITPARFARLKEAVMRK